MLAIHNNTYVYIQDYGLISVYINIHNKYNKR